MPGKEYLIPKYLNEFVCIGPECEDTCCRGWDITLDKKTYLKYKNSKNKVFVGGKGEKFLRDRKSEIDNNYGKIKLDDKGFCKFLENGLCSIQVEMGETYLSNTCNTYPRNLNIIFGEVYEAYLTLSCPEAARVCLFNEDGLEFVNKNLDLNLMATNEIMVSGYKVSLYNYFWDIRLFCLPLLQYREYSIGERLVILGIFLKKLIDIDNNRQYDKIENLIVTFSESIENKELDTLINRLKERPEVKLPFIEEILAQSIKQGVSNQRFIDCINDMNNGFSKSSDSLRTYYENDKYLKKYLLEKEFILENFLVNEFFGKMYPFVHNDIWNSYLFFCATYSLIYTMLVGMAGKYEKMTDDLIVKLIQSFSKVNLHSNTYVDSLVDFIKENDFDSLAHISILVL